MHLWTVFKNWNLRTCCKSSYFLFNLAVTNLSFLFFFLSKTIPFPISCLLYGFVLFPCISIIQIPFNLITNFTWVRRSKLLLWMKWFWDSVGSSGMAKTKSWGFTSSRTLRPSAFATATQHKREFEINWNLRELARTKANYLNINLSRRRRRRNNNNEESEN